MRRGLFFSKTVKICGMGESKVESQITDLEAPCQSHGGSLCQDRRGASACYRPR